MIGETVGHYRIVDELGVSRTRLVLPLTETTGSVWVLDNIER